MEISRVSDIRYKDFIEKYLSKNLPCLLEEKFTKNWKSRQEWISDGKPCFEFLRKSFGEAIVPVADCNQVKFQSHPKHSMFFKDFIEYWETKSNLEDNKSWYLKDWHFSSFENFLAYFATFTGKNKECVRFCEKIDYKAYETPFLFQSDWLNEFWDQWTDMKDDYRFVYMGPQGTWTPFHADVFRSYSWSANICGHKKWILYPPGSEEFLKDNHGNLVFDVTSSEVQDRKKFPQFDKAPQPLVVNQREGEIIFVPSCWHHQVVNMDDTISINHNWINGSGIFQTWQHLKHELYLVKRSIEDCKEMEEWDNQCQLILQANSGINFTVFFKFLCSISCARLHFLKMQFPENSNFQKVCKEFTVLMETNSATTEADTSPNTVIMNAKEHMFNSLELCLFDFVKLKHVLEQSVNNGDVEEKLKHKASLLLSCLTRVIDREISFQELSI